MLEKGVDMFSHGSFGETILHVAVSNNASLETIKLLLQNQANVNALDHSYQTPIHYANDKIATLLLEFNADPYIRNSAGKSALETTSNPAELEAILQCGIKGDHSNLEGWSAIHEHTINRHACKYLSVFNKYGYNLSSKSLHGWTPFQLACCSSKTKTANKILELTTLNLPSELETHNTLSHLHFLLVRNNGEDIPEGNLLVEMFQNRKSLSETGVKFLLELCLEWVWKWRLSRDLEILLLNELCHTHEDIRLAFLIIKLISSRIENIDNLILETKFFERLLKIFWENDDSGRFVLQISVGTFLNQYPTFHEPLLSFFMENYSHFNWENRRASVFSIAGARKPSTSLIVSVRIFELQIFVQFF
jgi:ankyrin repeat protein